MHIINNLSDYIMKSFLIICVFSVSCFANEVGPPIGPISEGEGATITIHHTLPNWAANMHSYESWHDDIYVIQGTEKGTGDTNKPDVQWRNDGVYNITHGAITGASFGSGRGLIVYRFITDPGYVFVGGSVNADVLFVGTPATQGQEPFFGVGNILITNGLGLTAGSAATYEKQQFIDTDTYGVYIENRSIDIPPGQNEFYVVFTDYDGRSNSSACFGYNSLTINALINAGEPAPVPEIVYADQFGPGWNAYDATDCFQQAINSGAKTIILRDMGSSWYVRPIFANSNNQHIIFKPGVVLEAKIGEFHGTSDKLFECIKRNNLKIEGYGATFKMQKNDYLNPDLYVNSVNRMAVSISSCNNVELKGLTIKDSGGDGIYIGELSWINQENANNQFCQNIFVKDVVCDNHYRNSISITSAKNVLIENSVFSNTMGSPPSAGVDFEPNNEFDNMEDVIFRNCSFTGNHNYGVMFALGRINEPISIRIEDCLLNQNGLGMAAFNQDDDDALGEVVIKNCNITENLDGGIFIRDKSSLKCHFSFKNCLISNNMKGVTDLDPIWTTDFPIEFRITNISRTQAIGGVDFLHCYIYEITDLPYLYMGSFTQGYGLHDVNAVFYGINSDGFNTDIGSNLNNVDLQEYNLTARKSFGSPMPEVNNGNSILLSEDKSQYKANLSTFFDWHRDVHAIVGLTNEGADSNNADVKWVVDGTYGSGHLVITGESGGLNRGTIAYKFNVPNGNIVTKGTVSARCLFIGTPDTQGPPAFFGVGTCLEFDQLGLTQICADAFNKAQFLSGGDGCHWADFVIDIPENVTEFYVVFSDSMGGIGSDGMTTSGARFAYESFNVDAVVKDSRFQAGDINQDYKVDSIDLTLLATDWLLCYDPNNPACQ